MASRWLVVPSSHVWVRLYSWFVGNSLRISVAILHVLTTMVPDYTRTSNRFHFEHHHEKPFRGGDGEGMICPAILAIFYCDFHAKSVVCNWEGKSERGHFELSKHTSRAPSAWSFKTTHRGNRRVNGLLHFRVFSGHTEEMMKRKEVWLWKWSHIICMQGMVLGGDLCGDLRCKALI